MALGHLSYGRRFLVEADQHLHEAVERAPSEESALSALEMAGAVALAEMRGEAAFGSAARRVGAGRGDRRS